MTFSDIQWRHVNRFWFVNLELICLALHVQVIFRLQTFNTGVAFLQGPLFLLLISLALRKYVWFKYDLGQKYYAPQLQPGRGLNSWPLNHDSTFHVTETPALTTWPSVTSGQKYYAPISEIRALTKLDKWLNWKLQHTSRNIGLYFSPRNVKLLCNHH